MTKRQSRTFTFHFRSADNGDLQDQDIIDKLDELALKRQAAQYVRDALREKMARDAVTG